MPAPRAFTATAHAVRDIADKALDQPEGVTLLWRADKLGLAECSRASRSFQVSFCSLRNRADRQRLKHAGDEPSFGLDIQSRGKYGKLACVRSALPNEGGWMIRLCAAEDVLSGVEVIDTKTGEEIRGETANERRARIVFNMLQERAGDVPREDWDWLLTVRPDAFEFCRDWLSVRRPDFYAPIAPVGTEPVVGQDALLDDFDMDDWAKEGETPT